MASPSLMGPPTIFMFEFASGPIFSMIPLNSCPGITGHVTFSLPPYMCLSEPQTPTAATRINRASSSISGMGYSRRAISPGCRIVAA